LIVVATICLAFAPLWSTQRGEGHAENNGIEVGGIFAAALFLIAFLFEIWLLRRHPERDWYDGRAVAESVKTLTWRYAVGGHPYPISRTEAADAFTHDVAALGTDVESLRPAVTGGVQVTDWMVSLRARPFEGRRDIYIHRRIHDQEQWYAQKATYNRRRATFWSFTLVTAEAIGVVFALLKGLGVVSIDLATIAAAVIASGAAWLAVKQHESIATAYALASSELGSVRLRIVAADEETWADEVASAEEAISREHTMWRAARSLPQVNDSR
jgi:hypothetical protein